MNQSLNHATGSYEMVSLLLLKIGVSAHLLGYKYIRSAVIMYSESSKMSRQIRITKDIYPAVAKEFNTTPQKVERAIRHAISAVFLSGDLKLTHSIFKATIKKSSGTVTNGDFIATLSLWIEKPLFDSIMIG